MTIGFSVLRGRLSLASNFTAAGKRCALTLTVYSVGWRALRPSGGVGSVGGVGGDSSECTIAGATIGPGQFCVRCERCGSMDRGERYGGVKERPGLRGRTQHCFSRTKAARTHPSRASRTRPTSCVAGVSFWGAGARTAGTGSGAAGGT